jgi:hypothetical protein
MTAEILKPFGHFETPGVDPQLVEMMEEILERARKGEITAVGVALINGANEIENYSHVGTAGWGRLLGAVTLMQHDICVDWNKP